MIDPDQVKEALEISAGYRLAGGGISEKQNASARAITVARRVIVRFLENLDEDTTVVEIREALESQPVHEEDGDDD